jgi:hypothetical protein
LAQLKTLGNPLSESQMILSAKAFDDYLNGMCQIESSNSPVTIPSDDDKTYLKTKIQKTETFLDVANTDEPFYKYLTRETLDKYVKQDNFQLGTINYYHGADPNAKDTLEGFTHFYIDQSDKQRGQAFYSGFNYLVFCGTYISPDTVESETLKKNFGDCVIKIKDINQFVRIVSNFLKSSQYYLRRVNYQPLKIVHTRFDEYIDEVNVGVVSPKMFDFIHKTATIPSIFMKKNYCIRESGEKYFYEDEHELRLAFKMTVDQTNPIQLKNLGLIDLVEIIKE